MSEKVTRTALLTGATGFIGKNLAVALLKDGWNIHLIVRESTNIKTIDDLRHLVQIHTHDGSTEQLLKIVADSSPDIVFHLASLFIATHSSSDIEQLVNSNLLFSTQLTEAMVQAGCWRLLNTGTSWEHFENAEYNPVNLYAATKQAFEAILTYYIATTQLQTITLKLFDSYGPGDLRPKLFTLLKRSALEGKPLAMSKGEQLIDLVYIDDIVRAYIISADRMLNGSVTGHERYAVSSGKPLSLMELVEIYGKVTGIELPIEWGSRPYRQREVMIPWQNGRQLPGWKPEVDLFEGIRRMNKDLITQ